MCMSDSSTTRLAAISSLVAMFLAHCLVAVIYLECSSHKNPIVTVIIIPSIIAIILRMSIIPILNIAIITPEPKAQYS